MRDKGGIVVVDGGRSVEQHRPQILLDVADLRGVLPHTVHDKLDVAAVQLQEFTLYQLGGVIVASDAERLSRRADSFQHEVYDLVQTLLVHFWVLRECVILDILPDDFTVNIYGTLFERFRSEAFRQDRKRKSHKLFSIQKFAAFTSSRINRFILSSKVSLLSLLK